MKILTYNIHRWSGRDGRTDIERLAEVIRQSDADVVSLNEVIHPVRRRGEIELPLRQLANLVDMEWAFGTSGRHIEINDFRGTLGNAILSRLNVVDVTNHMYPRLPGTQQRALLVAHLNVHGLQHPLTFCATHLDHALEPVRLLQIRSVLSRMRDLEYPHLIAGDFNTHTPLQRHWVPNAVGQLRNAGYVDVFEAVGRGSGATFPAPFPIFRIDYAFVPARWAGRLLHAEVVNTPLTRLASDHLPLLLEWDLASCYVH